MDDAPTQEDDSTMSNCDQPSNFSTPNSRIAKNSVRLPFSVGPSTAQENYALFGSAAHKNGHAVSGSVLLPAITKKLVIRNFKRMSLCLIVKIVQK